MKDVKERSELIRSIKAMLCQCDVPVGVLHKIAELLGDYKGEVEK